MIRGVTGAVLKDMILGAATLIEKNKDILNAMNVFPVPDGDTGTNMSLTMISAAKEVASLQEVDNIKRVLDALSLGALKGARGNSGVILSQIFSGFAKAGEPEESAKQDELEPLSGTHFMAKALRGGVQSAYKAVMKPKEGTILTVASSMADAAEEMVAQTKDISIQLAHIIQKGEETLKQTPQMLPVLKEAGVVDAGGAGLLMIVVAFKAVLDGEDVGAEEVDIKALIEEDNKETVSQHDIKYGYCTEFFIKNLYPDTKERDIDMFRNNLAKIGDSVLVVGNLNLVKTHVHTNEPGLALQYAQILGELSQIKIDNMREQHRELSEDLPEGYFAPQEEKNLVVVAVVSGDGIKTVFEDCQIHYFVEGGQSMNPSTEDILRAIEGANSERVIVLPNNKNIILAAQQAAGLTKKEVAVMQTKSIPQGIAAAIAYDPDADMNTNIEKMERAIAIVKTGLITHAVRDSKVDGNNIKKDDVIGIFESKIVTNGKDIYGVAEKLLSQMVDDDAELITLYYGDNIEKEEAQQMEKLLENKFDSYDVELLNGGQPIYQYMIAVE